MSTTIMGMVHHPEFISKIPCPPIDALLAKVDPTKGFVVGNFCYYNDIHDHFFMCEITETTEDSVHLVGLGWKLKTELTFER